MFDWLPNRIVCHIKLKLRSEKKITQFVKNDEKKLVLRAKEKKTKSHSMHKMHHISMKCVQPNPFDTTNKLVRCESLNIIHIQKSMF